jgi:hypothetical protein
MEKPYSENLLIKHNGETHEVNFGVVYNIMVSKDRIESKNKKTAILLDKSLMLVTYSGLESPGAKSILINQLKNKDCVYAIFTSGAKVHGLIKTESTKTEGLETMREHFKKFFSEKYWDKNQTNTFIVEEQQKEVYLNAYAKNFGAPTFFNTEVEEPTKDEYINERVFIPTKHNRPPELKPILTINDVPILTHQNISVIIASPGSGKSSVCEAVCSSAINPYCDSLGIKVSTEVRNVLFVDTERVNMDVWNSYDRMHKRAGVSDSDKAQIVGTRSIPRLDERKKVIIDLIEHHRPQLIILDGAGDMVTDTNSLEQAIETRIWFRELTMKYNLSILTTLHPNKGTKSPRGHIGSEILREAHAVFIIETNGTTKTLTNDFEHGKNRNGALISSSFAWSDAHSMFMSCDAPNNPAKKIEPHLELSNEEIISLVKDLTKTEIGATDFKEKMPVLIRDNHPNAKTGAKSIRDFYTWLQLHEYILVTGTSAKRLVQAHPSLEPKQESKQSELSIK